MLHRQFQAGRAYLHHKLQFTCVGIIVHLPTLILHLLCDIHALSRGFNQENYTAMPNCPEVALRKRMYYRKFNVKTTFLRQYFSESNLMFRILNPIGLISKASLNPVPCVVFPSKYMYFLSLYHNIKYCYRVSNVAYTNRNISYGYLPIRGCNLIQEIMLIHLFFLKMKALY